MTIIETRHADDEPQPGDGQDITRGVELRGQTPDLMDLPRSAQPAARLAAGGLPGVGLELLQVDPRTLIVGVNTRSDAALDKAFVGSVKDRGVREPIIVRRGEDGDLVVRKGQRRALAAVQAGLDLVPVVVEPEPLRDETAQQVDRIIDQLGENQHRTGLPEADEVVAHQQLLQLGLSAGQIARRTRTGTARIRSTLAVGGSELAAKAMSRYHLSLDQAAVIAEFDEDPDAVTALVAAAKASPGQFEHVAQRARDARTETRLRAELTARLQEAGVRTIDRPDPYRSRSTLRALDQLRPAPDSPSDAALEEAEHAGCPGHVAWLEHSWRSDEPVVIAYGCDGWAQYGHTERYAPAGRASSAPPAGSHGGPMTEDQKAERREVVANNKAWASAATVRLAWLRQFLARKTAPKDAATWITVTLADGCHDLRRAMEDQHSVARDLLGLGDTDDQRWYSGGGRPHPVAAAALTATPGRATVLTLALLLAAFEAGTSKDTWRHPSTASTAYLAALAGWGYELADIERLALDDAQSARNSSNPAESDDANGDDNGSRQVTADEEPSGGTEPEGADSAEDTGEEATDPDSTV